MTVITRLFSLFKTNNIYFLFVVLFLFSSKLSAQNDTIFFNSNWKITTKDAAVYYRLKPIKIKTKKAIGRKIEYVDSLYIIKDYYVKNNLLQFEGYSKDIDGNYNAGKAKWYNEDGTLLYSRDFNKPAPGTYKTLKLPLPLTYSHYIIADKILSIPPPILYLNYTIGNENKDLLTLGADFCLDCKTNNKLFLGFGYGLTNKCNGRSYGLPDLHLNYNYSILFVKAGTTDKNGYITGGFSLMNLIDLGLGYSLPYNENNIPSFKGFTTSVNIRFTRYRKAYSQFMGY